MLSTHWFVGVCDFSRIGAVANHDVTTLAAPTIVAKLRAQYEEKEG